MTSGLGNPGGVEMAALPGKTIFEINAFTRRVTPDEAQQPSLLVLGAVRMAYDEWARQVPARLWALAAERRMRIVIDASGEGQQHSPERSDELHRFLAERRVPADQAVYLTQDRGYGADYDAWRADHGVADGLRIRYADYFIRKFFLPLEQDGPALFEDRLARFKARSARREKRLVSLNLSPRESKVVFLLRLMRDGLWDDAFVSFGGIGTNFRGKKPVYKRWKREIAELAPYLTRLEDMGRFLIGHDGDYTQPGYRTPVYDQDMPEHDRSWFTVITETEMRDRPSRITEKPCKPLVNFHPVVFLGNPHALDHLREYGFQTFDGFFDEAYDRELDARRRFDLVYDQVAALCRADEAELARRTEAVEAALVHNARWGLTGLPADFRQRRDLELLKTVLLS